MSDAGPLLIARGVHQVLGGQPVLRDVDLEVRTGEITALLGPNGAGKTTLLRVLAGLALPTAGTVDLAGAPLASLPARARAARLAFVPQDTRVDLEFRVREFVALGRYPHLGRLRPAGPVDRAAVDAALDLADLGGLADRLLPTLSGGERQLAFLARAFAAQPEVVLLDEPFASLDVRHTLSLQATLRRFVAGPPVRAALLTLHEVDAALRLADRVAVLHQGRIAAEGPPAGALTDRLLGEVFGVEATRIVAPDGSLHLALRLPGSPSRTDPGTEEIGSSVS
jgi:iron complex transport system ATP-binding protein